jgi:signal transduction histidine kinase
MTIGNVTTKTWFQRLRYSLKARLIATFVFLAISMILVFVIGMQRGMTTSWREGARPLVQDYATRLFDEIGTPPNIERAKALTEQLPITVTIVGPKINWSNKIDHAIDENRSTFRQSSDHRAKHAQAPKNKNGHFDDGDHHDEHSLNSRLTADGHRIELGLKIREWRDRPRSIGWITLGALLGLIALSYFLVRRALQPIEAIRAGTQRIGNGQFDQPIANTGKDELGDLAREVNTMGERIASMLEAKRSLLLAMSHELRSPLTRARLNSELLAEEGEVAERRNALLRDLQEMAELIDHLLESEKLTQSADPAAGSSVLLYEQVNIKALLNQAKEKLVLREPKAQAIVIETDDQLGNWSIDSKRIDLLLRNLLENAIRYGAADQAPVLSATIGSYKGVDELVIKMRDFGSGVSDFEISQLSQAFWRPDTSRSRTSGGVGLGLYLCRLVAQAHHGRIEFRNQQPGLEVTVSIPKQSQFT